MIGKKFVISGMVIEIVSDDGESWKTFNITTKETVYFNKKFLQNMIKLGKAEEVSESDARTWLSKKKWLNIILNLVLVDYIDSIHIS